MRFHCFLQCQITFPFCVKGCLSGVNNDQKNGLSLQLLPHGNYPQQLSSMNSLLTALCVTGTSNVCDQNHRWISKFGLPFFFFIANEILHLYRKKATNICRAPAKIHNVFSHALPYLIFTIIPWAAIITFRNEENQKSEEKSDHIKEDEG